MLGFDEPIVGVVAVQPDIRIVKDQCSASIAAGYRTTNVSKRIYVKRPILKGPQTTNVIVISNAQSIALARDNRDTQPGRQFRPQQGKPSSSALRSK